MAGETAKTRAVCLDIRPWSRTSHVVTWLAETGPIATSVKGAVSPKRAFHRQYDLNYSCQEIGYFDCSHFIKEYKKHKGVTPKQHRMRMRKQKGEEVLNYFDENDLIQKE